MSTKVWSLSGLIFEFYHVGLSVALVECRF